MNSKELFPVSIKLRSPKGKEQTIYTTAMIEPFEEGCLFFLTISKRDVMRKGMKIIKGSIINTFTKSYAVSNILDIRGANAFVAKEISTNPLHCQELKVHVTVFGI